MLHAVIYKQTVASGYHVKYSISVLSTGRSNKMHDRKSFLADTAIPRFYEEVAFMDMLRFFLGPGGAFARAPIGFIMRVKLYRKSDSSYLLVLVWFIDESFDFNS